MSSWALAFALVLPGMFVAQAEPDSEEVVREEIIRRGDLVEHVTGDIHEADPLVAAISQIAADVPRIETDKFHLSVVTKKDCPACDALKKQWETDAVLRAYAVPESPSDSWAHLTIYDYDDKLQQWRWTPGPSNPNPVKISGFPTIMLQPPRNGQWGDPSTVIYKCVYEGDSQKFSREMNAALKRYVALQQQRQRVAQPDQLGQASNAPPPVSGGIGAIEEHADDSDEHEQARRRQADAAIRGGVGQQEWPPLVIPNDEQPRPVVTPDMLPTFGQAEIVIVYDRDQRHRPETEAAIQDAVDLLQAKYGGQLRERELDINKAMQLFPLLAVEDVPAVLVVEGARIREKLLVEVPRVRPAVLLSVVRDVLGVSAGTSAIGKMFGMLFYVAAAFAVFIVLCLLVLLGVAAARPALAQQATNLAAILEAPAQETETVDASAKPRAASARTRGK